MAETYKSFGTALNSTSPFTVYDPGSGVTGIVNAINVANVDGSQTSVTVILRKNGTDYRLIKDAAVPAQAALQVLDAPVPLADVDEIRVTAAHANRLEVIVSVLEIT
jgi:parvulin-like peptidyl-prolyl isomerase